MPMPTALATVSSLQSWRSSLETARRDPLREAADRLRRALPARADATVVADLLEDDLREGLAAVAEVESHFHEVLDALRSERLTPLALVTAGDDLRVLQRLDALHSLATQLRRRMSQAAGLLREQR